MSAADPDPRPVGTSTSPAPRSSVAERAVDRLVRRAERRGVSRRSFLVRAAVIGSALTVAPMRWILRPTSAYATICGSGASCGSGWTAFCCTINDGANTCPPGSYVAGWWKIDRSPFCGDAPRYIVDCNRSPGSSCTCRCASGTCDQRRVCCNNFRYGQCNTQVPGVTEVVCRVVICTSPWTWDPACGRTVRTDNRTTTHNAPCLPGTDASPIELRYQDLGLSGSVLGAPVAAERSGPRSGAWRRYEHGIITFQPAAGVRVLRETAAVAYLDAGGPEGGLGYPTADAEDLEGVAGERVRFERGDLYLTDDRATAIVGPAAARYRALGGPGGPLGEPVEGTRPVGDGTGSVTVLANGVIYASGRVGAQALPTDVAEHYEALGGPQGSGLGYPLGGDDLDHHPFERGLIVRSEDGLRLLRGAIARRFLELGGIAGPWGSPREDQRRDGDVERAGFAEVTVFASDTTRAAALGEPILAAYLAEGGPSGPLGLPTSDSFRTRVGHLRGSFQRGAIEIDPATGTTRVLDRRTTRTVSELAP